VTKEHNDECKKLLTLMGIPWLEAPCEAEAQCAALAAAGKVYAAGSEDMDTLCYKTPVLLRHLTFSEQRHVPVSEVFYEKVLEGLELPYEQFIDLCILLGCDYCEPIKGIGPATAYKLIREHKDLDTLIPLMQKGKLGKFTVPDNYPYKDARDLFLHPEVTPADQVELHWKAPDVEGLVDFLVKDKGFNEDRVRQGATRLQKNLKTAQQGRLDSFFAVIPKSAEEVAAQKRKYEEKQAEKKKKQKLDTVAKKASKKAPRASK